MPREGMHRFISRMSRDRVTEAPTPPAASERIWHTLKGKCLDNNSVWITIGFFGQALFTGRFFVQWIASERRKASVVPRAFWFLSLGGGVVLLAYAIYRRDPVFIVGQATGLFIYTRNLWFIYRPGAAVIHDATAARPYRT